jgi:hypothetical protein
VTIRPPIIIAGHEALFDGIGRLIPWTSWMTALDLEMKFYQTCPLDHGYPRFACETFLDGEWTPSTARSDTIPTTQNGMGIISYLKFYQLHGLRESVYLEAARSMGDYLLREALTPRDCEYPLFTRSTGKRAQFPQPADSGSQSDRPYEIQPDKGGIGGYALTQLFEATGDARYFDQALHNARVLAAHQAAGDSFSSPWPFRVDYRDGSGRGPISGNMVYILRLYDALARLGVTEFSTERAALWEWIKRHQIPSAAAAGELFAQFFEDHDTPTNRTAWAPLNLARYLLEERDAVDADWSADCSCLIEFVRRNFTHLEFGIKVCHEQDEDHQAWGGVNSTYGAVLALHAKATGSAELAAEACQALNFTLYSIDERGRPRDVFSNPGTGGWQEDAHTDVIHNFVDAIQAYPEWAQADGSTSALLVPGGA